MALQILAHGSDPGFTQIPPPWEQRTLFHCPVTAVLFWSGHWDVLGSRIYDDVLVQSPLGHCAIDVTGQSFPMPRLREDWSDRAEEWYTRLGVGGFLLFGDCWWRPFCARWTSSLTWYKASLSCSKGVAEVATKRNVRDTYENFLIHISPGLAFQTA